MKKSSFTIIAFMLCGCTTPSTVFITPEGKIGRCAAHGWGYVGVPMAQKIHDQCVSDMQYSGALPTSAAGGIGVLPSAETNSVLILKVAPNSPAEKAGLKPSNRIIKVNSQPVNNWIDARRLLFGQVGTEVSVTFIDGVTEKTVSMIRSRTVESN